MECRFYLNVTDTPQNLTSPGYPSLYPNNLDCQWILTAQLNYRISIVFLDFKTELHYDKVVVSILIYNKMFKD